MRDVFRMAALVVAVVAIAMAICVLLAIAWEASTP